MVCIQTVNRLTIGASNPFYFFIFLFHGLCYALADSEIRSDKQRCLRLFVHLKKTALEKQLTFARPSAVFAERLLFSRI